MHPERPRVADHVARRARRPQRQLLEDGLVERRRERDPLPRVARERHAGLAELAEALRPEPGERDEPAEREQRLVGRHVRRRLLAADVLLARLQREDEAAVAVRSVVWPTIRPGMRRMNSVRAARKP